MCRNLLGRSQPFWWPLKWLVFHKNNTTRIKATQKLTSHQFSLGQVSGQYLQDISHNTGFFKIMLLKSQTNETDTSWAYDGYDMTIYNRRSEHSYKEGSLYVTAIYTWYICQTKTSRCQNKIYSTINTVYLSFCAIYKHLDQNQDKTRGQSLETVEGNSSPSQTAAGSVHTEDRGHYKAVICTWKAVPL